MLLVLFPVPRFSWGPILRSFPNLHNDETTKVQYQVGGSLPKGMGAMFLA
ncbi:unnamed protein product [Ectocarpus sp. CCAP 1310/34]|nr:unnamed protein product [Ectocarpus sp. CCAP 1310/34]